MTQNISSILASYESGGITRRELVRGLAMMMAAAVGTPVAAADGFKSDNLNHISIVVSDLQKSSAFYQRTFGLTVLNENKEQEIVRLKVGDSGTHLSLRRDKNAGVVEHIAIGINDFKAESVTADLKQRGATPLNGNGAGLHVDDPDGLSIQLFSNRE